MLLSSGVKKGANDAPGLSVTRRWPLPSAFMTQRSILDGFTRSSASSLWNVAFAVESWVRYVRHTSCLPSCEKNAPPS